MPLIYHSFHLCSSFLGLLYQANNISHEITLFNALQETRSQLNTQIHLLGRSINRAQDALRERSKDPRQILQALFYLDRSFQATDEQIAGLCAGFGWESSDLLLEDPLKRGYELREVADDLDTPFRIFVKGTSIDITGKKASEWKIDSEDNVVPKFSSSMDLDDDGASVAGSAIDDSASVSISGFDSPSPYFVPLQFLPDIFGTSSRLLKHREDDRPPIWTLPLCKPSISFL